MDNCIRLFLIISFSTDQSFKSVYCVKSTRKHSYDHWADGSISMIPNAFPSVSMQYAR